MSQTSTTSPQPWWRFPHVWMVVAGPAIVVVASFIMMLIGLIGVWFGQRLDNK